MNAKVPKPAVTVVSDAAEIAALKAAGRWKNGVPLWWQSGNALIVESEPLKAWREARATEGKRL